jgi:DNA-binding response OmpR family regulator
MAHILVVDDDPAIRQLLIDILAMDGHEARVAVDGVAAVRALEVLRPDCVILDVMMPGLDGYGVLRNIRAQEGDPVPVIMLTAAAEPNTAARAWADGADYFLAKPFGTADVLDLVDTLLGDSVPVADGGAQ